MEWQPIQFIREPTWLEATSVKESVKENASLAYRSQFLTFELIILDAHIGVYLERLVLFYGFSRTTAYFAFY